MKLHILHVNSQAKGADMQQITTGEAEEDSPAWSPDGKTIAHVSVTRGVSHIQIIINIDGTGSRRLTKEPGQNIHPTWSSDGSHILFNTTHFAEEAPKTNLDEHRIIGERTDDLMDLAIIRPDGSGLKRITYGGGYTYASYSPDDRHIVHRRQQGEVSQIFLMNSDGTNDLNLSGSSTWDGWPSWSPDGQRIVFSRHTPNGFQLFVMDREGNNLQQLTDAQGEFVNPRWSPDGTRILCGRRLGGISLALLDAPA